MQNDQNPSTPQDGTQGFHQAPRSNQSGPSPGRFVGASSVESFQNQPSPASQRGQHLHPGFQRPGFPLQGALGEHAGPTMSPRSQASSSGGGAQFRPVRSPMNRSVSGNSQVPSNYYNQNSPFVPINYNPMSENPGAVAGYGSSGASMQSTYRGQAGPFPASNPGSVSGPGATGNSPFPGPGPSSGAIGLGGQGPGSGASPFPGPGPSSNAAMGFPGPGPSSNAMGFPGPGPSGNSPFPASGNSGPNPAPTYFPPRSNENPPFPGPGPQMNISGAPPRPIPAGSVSFRPELGGQQPPILHPQVPPHQVQQMQHEQYMRQQQQEFMRQHPRFLSQPQPRPMPPPSDMPGSSTDPPPAQAQPGNRVSPPPAAFPAPGPRPLDDSILQIPAHLISAPFPGPGPDPDESPNEPWKDRVMALVPTPTVPLGSLEGLSSQSTGYLCGFAKDIIQEIQTRLIHMMSTYRHPNWNATLFADMEVEVKYTHFLFKRLIEMRAFIDRRMVDTEDISTDDFIQMMAFSSEKPKIPKELKTLREDFAENTDLLVQISSKLKEVEWLSACGDPRATGSMTRDELLRMTTYEESRRKHLRGGPSA